MDNLSIIQIGSHIGKTQNDPIFNYVNKNTNLILVEPVPYLFKQLKLNYQNKLNSNSNIVFVNKAISDKEGKLKLTIPSESNDFTKLPFWASQLASVNPNHAKGHLPNLLVETIEVESITLDKLIQDYQVKNIDFLHTDTEGHDYNILMNYSFTIKPKRLMFEYKHMDGLYKHGDKFKKLIQKLETMGYRKIHQNDEDILLVLK